jgi:hypothetical protein
VRASSLTLPCVLCMFAADSNLLQFSTIQTVHDCTTFSIRREKNKISHLPSTSFANYAWETNPYISNRNELFSYKIKKEIVISSFWTILPISNKTERSRSYKTRKKNCHFNFLNNFTHCFITNLFFSI